KHAEHVLNDQYLPIAPLPGTNSYCRNLESLRHTFGYWGRDQLEYHRESTRVLQSQGIVYQALSCSSLPPLYSKPTELMDRLRCHPKVTHDGYADLCHATHHRDNWQTALNLYGINFCFLHETTRIFHCPFN